jgi:uncharacterized membrane protein YfcA
MIIIIGMIIGFILGLLGAGGTILAVPFLVFGLNMDPKEAIPLSMFAIALSSFYGTVYSLRKKQVRYKAASLIAITGILLSPIGIWIGNLLPRGLLMLLFSGILFWVAIRMIVNKKSNLSKHKSNQDEEALPCEMNNSSGKLSWNMRCARALSFTGALTGLMSGMLGVGGGFIIVPALKKYSNIQLNNIFPTSIAVIAVVACFNSVLFFLHGRLNISLALLFCIGSIIGMMGAKKITMNTHLLEKLFAYFLILIALFLIIKVNFL